MILQSLFERARKTLPWRELDHDRWRFGNLATVQQQSLELHIPQLLLGHAEIMTEFMYESLANLMTNFRLIGADRLNVLLIKHDVSWTYRNIKDALLRRWHSMKDAQKQSPLLAELGWCLVGRKILDEDRDVMDTAPKFFWERVERLLNNLDESFVVHLSPAENRLPQSGRSRGRLPQGQACP